MKLGPTYMLIAVESDASGDYWVGFWAEQGEGGEGRAEQEEEGKGG